MSQPQLSVREKAREMFDEKFDRLLSNKDADKFVFVENDVKNFIDQIITLAQEEKIDAIEEALKKELVFPDGMIDSDLSDVMFVISKILKQ